MVPAPGLTAMETANVFTVECELGMGRPTVVERSGMPLDVTARARLREAPRAVRRPTRLSTGFLASTPHRLAPLPPL
jgi:hypothetical protein